LQEIYQLPASEIVVWKEYFGTYPFSQDRQDMRFALLCQTVSNMSGRTLKESAQRAIEDFMPDYFGRRSPDKVSIEQQERSDREFGEKLMQLQAMAKQ
jgi:hypothetical protein